MSEMSPYRALLTVDASGFGEQPDALLPFLHHEIHAALTSACERSSLKEPWESVSLLQRPGDELVALLPVETLPLLVHPFLDNLQDELARTDQRVHDEDRGPRLRLRAALHVGSVEDDGSGTTGIARAVNDVHRLLNCDPLRDALCDSDPDVTFLAAIISSEAFSRYVEGGRTSLDDSRFTKVRAKAKKFDQPAWVYVPRPSRLPEQAVPATPQEGAAGD
ncbi:hypothetical protein AB0B89_10465 [Sphaerisporangium sp. NPDC049002]|uniref:hypothetical protein n=1 Tax=Sphaerisporangium sp. NPDC049002 TaxID=3155392 RepID=UPI0034009E96